MKTAAHTIQLQISPIKLQISPNRVNCRYLQFNGRSRRRTTTHDHERPRTTTNDHERPRKTTNDHERPRITDRARPPARERPRTTDHARTTAHERPRMNDRARPRKIDHAIILNPGTLLLNYRYLQIVLFGDIFK